MTTTVEEYLNLPYTIEIVKDEGDEYSGWFASVVELPGCMTQAEKFEELPSRIKDAMTAWIESALEDGVNMPLPSSIEDDSKQNITLNWNQFIEKTYGSLADAPIERGEQGQYEIREAIIEDNPHSPIILYRNPEPVMAFLTKHPEINDFIDSACPVLANYFGKPVKIILELMYYPDGPEYQDLVGWIQSTDDVIVGLDKLEKFEDEWYLDNMYKVNNKFDFNLETR